MGAVRILLKLFITKCVVRMEDGQNWPWVVSSDGLNESDVES
jgi:hypothetical protein